MESMCGLISRARPTTWTACATSPLPSFGLASLVAFIVTAFAGLTLLIPWTLAKYNKMQQENKAPFPLMNLPRELRDLIYEHLIEEPEYPPPPPTQKLTPSISWMLPDLWKSSSSSLTPYQKPGTWILLANKQVHKEYTSLLTKRATFHLTVSSRNYQNPTQHNPNTSVWKISPSVLQRIRSCTLQLVTTSAMLGVTDPRNMTSADWTLAKQIRRDLEALTGVKYFSLESKAIGDPLWNPLWIWYHACQSFKDMGHAKGPKLDKITFSLDTWSPGENHMARDKKSKGVWTWYCPKGHSVGLDGGEDVTVREFCGMLYRNCRVCRPNEGQ
ncbi:hypothetical protein CC86DRAFT_369223 [Ophiobolus disseminans]|uniref:Uncharacterized protein n=1 Tax=Ophiobolus disseminans TaxID=1469910 RepID=A0A6A7A5M8_9PLEO|nr:hypothetical protein CC86DRAFT_369223 [Ophiobolus disseminans]